MAAWYIFQGMDKATRAQLAPTKWIPISRDKRGRLRPARKTGPEFQVVFTCANFTHRSDYLLD